VGTLFFLIGFGSVGYITVSKFLYPETSITNKPAFYIALTSMLIGVQLFLAGFIAELINRNAPDRNHYLIAEKIGW
jgi:TRAP-type C4-dicarboxylate transport system permease small subunit